MLRRSFPAVRFLLWGNTNPCFNPSCSERENSANHSTCEFKHVQKDKSTFKGSLQLPITESALWQNRVRFQAFRPWVWPALGSLLPFLSLPVEAWTGQRLLSHRCCCPGTLVHPPLLRAQHKPLPWGIVALGKSTELKMRSVAWMEVVETGLSSWLVGWDSLPERPWFLLLQHR